MKALILVSSAALAVSLAATPAYAQAAPAASAETQALRAEVEALRARLEALEARLAASAPAARTEATPAPGSATPTLAAGSAPAASPPAAATKPATKIEWKGSPQFVDGDKTFKVKGRIQADANYVSAPKGSTDRGLGFSNEFRRLRLGAEGSIGAGFGYKFEMELTDNTVDPVDTFITYTNGPWQVRLGNQNAGWSLDELIGDTSGTVMERAAFTDAFNFERRLGLQAQYAKGALVAQLGVFSDDPSTLANANDGPNGGDEDNSHAIDGRIVLAPKLGATQLHFGASLHYRDLGRLVDGGTRYRQRPFVHSTNTRFIGTPSMAVTRELGYGGEFAAVNGRWHAAAEVFFQNAVRRAAADPTFWGAYGEIGYFLTDDTRPYKEGIFGATKPKNPVGSGGMGSLQLTARYDYLTLNDKDIVGGKQNAWIGALVWTPISGLRFNLNAALLSYSDAVAMASGKTSYDVTTVGTRFEFDF